MSRTIRPKWTCGRNTQVAKRKRERFIRALVAALSAAFKTGKSVDLDDYMTRDQVWIAYAEAQSHGMTVGEWATDMIHKSIVAYNAAHP